MTDDTKRDITVVTVHGTGDTAAGPDGEKWFQRGSTFTEQLKAALAARGFNASIVPQLWSGANSARQREQGADKLADLVKRLNRKQGAVHIIGHSHGGNVANEAADFLHWGRKTGANRIASLTTVGTPFFRNTTGAAEAFAGIVFLILTVLSALAVFVFALAAIVLIATGDLVEDENALVANTVTLALILGTAAAMYFMLRLAIEGARRILRPTKRSGKGAVIHAIWHRNDEAIAFLQKIEATPIEPFTKGTLIRGSRGAAIVWGVRAVLAIGGVGVYTLFAKAFGWPVHESLVVTDPDATFGPVPDFIVFAILCTPLIFILVYGVYRFIFGVLLELALRGRLNKAFAGILRGMAFGKDGDQRLDAISPTSHTHPSIETVIDGPVADRMQVNAAAAANKLIEKYRYSLFQVSEDTTASITELAKDSMTWDSLIHTTYFDQPEMAEIIAAHIAEQAAKA